MGTKSTSHCILFMQWLWGDLNAKSTSQYAVAMGGSKCKIHITCAQYAVAMGGSKWVQNPHHSMQ